MGNKKSCCSYSSPSLRCKNPSVNGEIFVNLESNLSETLQHISERGDDDLDTDPSLHPKAATIFLERSRAENMRAKRRKSIIREVRSLKTSNSCSTIYLDDNTVSRPNLKSTLKCVSYAIFYHIKNRKSERQMDIFDDKLHPLRTIDEAIDDHDVFDDEDECYPKQAHIYKFIRTLFTAAKLTAECAIITLVYLEKLLTYADVDIMPGNWRRIVLGAVLLASKVWDDQAIWNIDYCQILADMSVEDMNELERQFLEMIQFNINVPASVYVKYYFDLRSLAEYNDLIMMTEPLTKRKAQKLEAMSRIYPDKAIAEAASSGIKRWSSLDSIKSSAPSWKGVAILP